MYLLVLMYEFSVIGRVNFSLQQMDRKEIHLLIDNNRKLRLSLELGPLTDVNCVAHSLSYREEKEYCLMCSLSSALGSLSFLPPFSFMSNFSLSFFLQSERIKTLIPFWSVPPPPPPPLFSIPTVRHLIIQHPTLPTCQLLPSVSS